MNFNWGKLFFNESAKNKNKRISQDFAAHIFVCHFTMYIKSFIIYAAFISQQQHKHIAQSEFFELITLKDESGAQSDTISKVSRCKYDKVSIFEPYLHRPIRNLFQRKTQHATISRIFEANFFPNFLYPLLSQRKTEMCQAHTLNACIRVISHRPIKFWSHFGEPSAKHNRIQISSWPQSSSKYVNKKTISTTQAHTHPPDHPPHHHVSLHECYKRNIK